MGPSPKATWPPGLPGLPTELFPGLPDLLLPEGEEGPYPSEFLGWILGVYSVHE